MRTVTLSQAEWLTILEFLEEHGNCQSNAGCNDLPRGIQKFYTEAEGKAIADEFAKYNNPSEPEGPSWPLPDFCLLSLLQNKIKKQL